MSKAWRSFFLFVFVGFVSELAAAKDVLPTASNIDPQPMKAQATRIVQALELLGAPLTPSQKKAFDAALAEANPQSAVAGVQAVLDPLCLCGVEVNAESRVKVVVGSAPKQLLQHGWSVFLVKVNNEAGVTAPLAVSSPNAMPLHKRSTSAKRPEQTITSQDVENRWLDVSLNTQQPLLAPLSGLKVEYRIVELYSRDSGQREAKLAFDVGQGSQDLGFRSEANILFDCKRAVPVRLDILDDDGTPTVGQFVFRDALGRVYPSRSRRLAPDLFFHDQIYRHSGETVLLPPGKFEALYTRGPEYRILKRTIEVPDAAEHRESFRLQRWIKLTDYGWYSGDHHIHAAGCAHYESPAEGVQPEHMMRHILGEDLNVGCVLSWGPCWYYQKQFFEGRPSKLSVPGNLMRYDIEVSGFPSSHAGHLCLLRLKEDDYPNTTTIEEWPSWDLPILQWGKQQGGVVGYSHSGWGLKVAATSLPTYEMPPFDGIGANEYIVDTVHGVCDFISAVDTPAIWELNIWYHTLNCGMTTRISGETDFPCIYGDRVGLGRAYVKLRPNEPLDYDRWADGIRDGRSYCSDGLTHLYDFTVAADGAKPLGVGESGDGGRASVLKTPAGKSLKVRVNAAALLEETPRKEIRETPLDKKPYWHVERARIGDTRTVPIELIVNGQSVQTKPIVADGKVHEVEFDYMPSQSSWIAVRTFPAAHTNPVFVEVDGKPIRASKRSAQWCLDAVDVCWAQKVKLTRDSEKEAAAAAYETARAAYRRVLGEATVD
ncbi:MAG: CehA/McbA family metallohydrolase [Planctomycetia bacterium]|nr:CehA/McbA family metallohydrolase [Planctomycetia bacterium]